MSYDIAWLSQKDENVDKEEREQDLRKKEGVGKIMSDASAPPKQRSWNWDLGEKDSPEQEGTLFLSRTLRRKKCIETLRNLEVETQAK